MKQRSKRLNKLLICLCIAATAIVLWILYLYNVIPHRQFSDQSFNVAYTLSSHDQNKNGIDDFIDLWLGAEREAQRAPFYVSAYYEGGYPPSTQGVCSDLIWRAFRDAGYDFKAMIDTDIAACSNCYPRIHGQSDPNIDFRRVANIRVFVERYGEVLTCDLSNIGILSDVRNHEGIPFLLHNGGLPKTKEDCLKREQLLKGISGHYRFQYTEKIEKLLSQREGA